MSFSVKGIGEIERRRKFQAKTQSRKHVLFQIKVIACWHIDEKYAKERKKVLIQKSVMGITGVVLWSCQEGLSSTELKELSLSIIGERQSLWVQLLLSGQTIWKQCFTSAKHEFVWKQNFRQENQQEFTTIFQARVQKQKSEMSVENVTKVHVQK